MQRSKRKAAERDSQVKVPHIRPDEATAGLATSPEVAQLRKRLLEMIVRRESQRKAKPK